MKRYSLFQVRTGGALAVFKVTLLLSNFSRVLGLFTDLLINHTKQYRFIIICWEVQSTTVSGKDTCQIETCKEKLARVTDYNSQRKPNDIKKGF